MVTESPILNKNSAAWLKIALLNARSVRNKVPDICESLESKNISICGLTETWLGDDENVITREFREQDINFCIHQG